MAFKDIDRDVVTAVPGEAAEDLVPELPERLGADEEDEVRPDAADLATEEGLHGAGGRAPGRTPCAPTCRTSGRSSAGRLGRRSRSAGASRPARWPCAGRWPGCR